MLDDVAGVADDAGNEDLALGQLRLAPDLPLVLVLWVRRLDGVRLRRDLEHQIYYVLQGQAVRVRSVPASPAGVVADAVLRKALEGVVHGVDADFGGAPVVVD